MPAEPAKSTVILVSPPGVLHNALLALFQTMALVEVVAAVSGGASAYERIKQQAVALVVMDANLPQEEIHALLRLVKQAAPQTRCLVLTNTNRRKAEFLTAGADIVLLRHSSIEQLTTAVEKALQKGAAGNVG